MIVVILLCVFFLIGGLPGVAGAVFGLIGYIIEAIDKGITWVMDHFEENDPE